ncbi:uncharacterized protein EURHEDRAFT_378618 [Aspergillus ruber CBS 135680]|uniref:Phosphoglycerate mutase-like protein n=1 Tax=Aspergillus ruber (strain CBS 135680) TaxID=1388766 RepID=A0A017SAM1_ASPRC|nr:phosphoglycerate mutase-like protein [Aspergillus ruber CBS 135680]EYE93982.1 phosphoglycerate mutase-like protein [Aspergillus ruber CBS 135680]
MFPVKCWSLALAVTLQAATSVSAQGLSEKVWAVFAYTLHGDSVPTALPRPQTLSPYGANELYTAGSSFRDRYVAVHFDDSAEKLRIQNLSPYVLDSEEVIVLSSTEQSDVGSAQAFMQGLYPPLKRAGNLMYSDSSSVLANGSIITAPFEGYQYPQILAPSSDDPQSLVVAGHDQCRGHEVASSEYQSSNEFQQITQETEAFYIGLYDQALSGVYYRSSVTYKNACDIAEYLEYELIHNGTLMHVLSMEDIKHARLLADQYLWATNGRRYTWNPLLSSFTDGAIHTIAGRTLASRILEAFGTNVQYRGTNEKMTLAFGGPEPAIALASLTKLSSRYDGFYPRPSLGGSMVFELYSRETEDNPTYPDPSELYVRFVLHNGTDTSTRFTTYPLFGYGPSNIEMPYSEFQAEMEQIATRSTREWCHECGSSAVFCSGVLSRNREPTNNDDSMDPVVAGVIGAVVTIVIFASIGSVFGLLTALRNRKLRQGNQGGFKGDRKMAGDADITFKNPSWGDAYTAGKQKSGDDMSGAVVVRGQERSGSWEMTEPKERNGNSPTVTGESMRSPFDDDNENDEEYLVHSAVEPAKVREAV